MAQTITISTLPIISSKNSYTKKKKKSAIKITYTKLKIFFWNLSPIHWYDTFKEIHVDMNEFISPKK
jgi:hypothetical protein